jgi:hypothetical protein
LDVLKRVVQTLGEELPALVIAELQSELKKYSPDQSRVPAGNRDGGQWTSGVAQQTMRVAARRISPAREAECEAQYAADIFQCKMVGLMACYAQAALRYANCLQGLPLPPLNY